ncbi:MAG: xanthine dehydrogenase family protein molybdopterin-binding subunit [Acidimicrobiales bacterium]
MSILGNRVVRVEDPRFLTGGATYMADLADPRLEGAACVTFVRSPVAHAEIRAVHIDDASASSGVVGVFTGAEIDLDPLPPALGILNRAMTRPWLASDRARFVGEPVAAVVTERAEQGVDAAERVIVDYVELPPLVDVEAADRDEIVLHPDAGTNCALELTFGHTGDRLFDGCEVIVRQRLVNQRLAACPLEGRGAAAAWDGDGRLHLWLSTQHVHGVHRDVVRFYGLDERAVRVVTPDVGGGFGPKIGAHAEDLLLPWIARRLGRPVRWHETRTENMLAMGHGRGQVQTVEIGGRCDGAIEAYRLTVVADAGAYPDLGAFLPYLTRIMTPGVYAIARVEANTRSVVTTTNPTRAYRGAGRPEATAAIERAIDLFAAEVGLDPAEVRRLNLVAATDFPYTNAVGTTYDSGDYERALDLALDTAGYSKLRAEQQQRRADGERVVLGIGLAVYVEVTAGPERGEEYARITAEPDGAFTVYTGTSPHGQGLATSFAMLAADELGVAMECVAVVHGDTDLVPEGGGTMGSRSLQLGGPAVKQAAAELVALARDRAADVLEADPTDVVLDRVEGCFHVAGSPAVSLSWLDVVRDAVEVGETLAADGRFEAATPTYPFGAHVAVVEVDTDTGAVRLRRLVAVDDAGRLLNPLIAEGQRHGGIAQGVAQALYEEFRYDADGNPLTTNLADYAFPSAAELPSFDLVPMETPTPVNPLGAKGIGESGTLGASAAVHNAVCDALAHLGVRHLDMPCTPERVWRAIRDAPRVTA